MQLYMLALEMGVRSTELVARARDLGLHDVGVDTWLRPDQIAALRAGSAPPSQLLSPPVAPDAPWGARPPSGPTHGVPPQPFPHGGPQFGGHLGGQPPNPPPAGPPPPGFPGWAPVPPMPSAGGPANGNDGRKAIVVTTCVVLVLIVGFVVFVNARSGTDRRERRERAEVIEARAEKEREEAAREHAARFERGGPVEGGSESGASDGWDRAGYCGSARSLMRFENDTGQAGFDGDFDEFLGQVVAGRDQWRIDVDHMIATDPDIAEDLTHYRGLYETYLWSISHETTLHDLELLTNEIMKGDLIVVAGRINRFTEAECG